MHDGQNLFDPATSFAGEWGVDSALARAPRKGRRAIVVGIPNAGLDRIREYSPFADPKVGGGMGDAYLDWLEGTVKPLIDDRYRTIRSADGTGIGGSSLGGLISLYAFFRSPARYGFTAALSPALWFGDGRIFRFVESAGYVRGRIYLDVGTREGEGTLANAREMRDLLLAKGYRRGRDLMWVEDKGGMHNEAAWGRRLKPALPFLLGGVA
jgi:predicted alpha/beta superfamily hydrolase